MRLDTGNQQSAWGFLAPAQAHVFTRGVPAELLCPMQSAFVQARRQSKGAVPATGTYGSVSARSHQTLPKLTNGPSSVEMRVLTWYAKGDVM